MAEGHQDIGKDKEMKLGILTNSVDASQHGYLLCREMNKICSEKGDLTVAAFYHEYGKITTLPLFPIMQSVHSWGFDGVFMSTCIQTTRNLLKIPSLLPKFFYVWNLEWIHNPGIYKDLLDIYNNDEVELVARSESHYEILTRCWKEPKFIIEDYDYETVIREITKHGK